MDENQENFDVYSTQHVETPTVEDFNEEMENLSKENDDVQSDDLKQTLTDHRETLVKEAQPMESPEQSQDLGWTLHGKETNVFASMPAVEETNKSQKSENHYTLLANEMEAIDENVDDDNNGNFDSTEMEQSMESELLPDSPPKKLKKSYKEQLLDRPDREYHKKGWAQVSHVIAKGDSNSLSVDDILYYICHAGSSNLQQSKRDHLDNFLDVLEVKMKTYKREVNLQCNHIVDRACNAISKEDTVVFNKMRANTNQLDGKIAESRV
jgi:hypothetical protein